MRVMVTGGSGFVGRQLISFLKDRGYDVVAIARSEGAERTVVEAGATPARADLDDVPALQQACSGCEVVFHCAAFTGEWAPWETFRHANVTGTENVLKAARLAGVRRVVHVSTEAVLLDGEPLVGVDESRPIPEKTIGFYGRSKALAEKAALEANGDGLEVVVIRPRFVWGRGDTTLVPKLAEAVRSGRFKWIDGGKALTSTCHVQNVCAGAVAAAERGVPGQVYFLTDGPPISAREMLTRLLDSAGVQVGDGSLPLWVARAAAAAIDTVWTTLEVKKAPPVSLTAVLLIGNEMTVSDAKARRELGYEPVISRDAGLAELAATSTR